METWLILTLAVWWAFAVVTLALLIQDVSRNAEDRIMVVTIAAAWPLFLIPALIYGTYQMLVASKARILMDLKNRGVLAEFEEWLEQRNEEKLVETEKSDAE